MTRDEERRFRAIAIYAAPAVGAYLRRRLYPLPLADLDDLVAEVFIVAWKRLDSVPESAEVPWLIGVARNVLRNAQRSYRRRQTAYSRVRSTEPAATAEDSVVANESIRLALDGLSDEEREILLLKVWDGFSTTEIAQIFGITTNATAVRLSRAQAKFRLQLEPDQLKPDQLKPDQLEPELVP